MVCGGSTLWLAVQPGSGVVVGVSVMVHKVLTSALFELSVPSSLFISTYL